MYFLLLKILLIYLRHCSLNTILHCVSQHYPIYWPWTQHKHHSYHNHLQFHYTVPVFKAEAVSSRETFVSEYDYTQRQSHKTEVFIYIPLLRPSLQFPALYLFSLLCIRTRLFWVSLPLLSMHLKSLSFIAIPTNTFLSIYFTLS
jgi:hypothetical protein